ncbi:MAG: hypothetical protein HAW67_07850, partial [Endozoicomonadaceae bacterium]|nr:hypothetical protein [Endozoicomonadaceae bacterium]
MNYTKRNNMMKCGLLLLGVCIFSVNSVYAASKREKVKVYKERVENQLREITLDQLEEKIFPFREDEVEVINDVIKRKDAFFHSPSQTIKIQNHEIIVKPSPMNSDEIPLIKLGHNFTTTIVFTDKVGKPWSVDTLTDVSDSVAFSVEKKTEHIITVRGNTAAGEANLPILLKGEQYPIIFHFKITPDEAYFIADIKVDGYGDNSQATAAVRNFTSRSGFQPRYDIDEASRKMLLGVTPAGYKKLNLVNEYGAPASRTDVQAWLFEKNIFVLTPYQPYAIKVRDVQLSADGVTKLFKV